MVPARAIAGWRHFRRARLGSAAERLQCRLVPFANGQPSGQRIDILTGFLSRAGDALGRPAGVAVDKTGALLVADDVGNTVWRVTPAAQQAER
jgi:glucose/arabinose dehydrogenase